VVAILITGAGLIGCYTARLLADRGERVVLLDIAPEAAAIRTMLGERPVELVQADIQDETAVARIVESRGVDRILHSAAMLTTSIRTAPLDGVRVNIGGTAVIYDIARRHGVKRVVLGSSSTIVYATFGTPAAKPYVEDFPMRVVSERPMSLYAETKLACEHIGLLYHDNYGLDFVALRYAAVIGLWSGPNNSIAGRLVRALLAPALAGAPSVVDDPVLVWLGGEEFVDVRDVAAANVAALFAPQPQQRVYNVANGALWTFDDFVAGAREVVPSLALDLRVTPRAGFAYGPHIRKEPCDIAAAARELGFRPQQTVGSAMQECAQWLRRPS
jgi:UDP-glucose 4-epimerase